MAHIQQAQEAMLSKNFQEAIKILDQALLVNSKDISSLFLKCQVCFQYGMDLGAKGEKQQSQEKLTQCIETVDLITSLNPKLAKANAFKGQAIQRLENPSRIQEAIDCYQKVIDAGEKIPDVYFNKGICLKQLKQYEMALESLKQAQNLKPGEFNYFRAIATVLELLERYDEAINEYKKCLQFHPNNSMIYYEMALDWQKLGKEDEQMESYKVAIQLDPTNNEAKYNYAMLLDKKSQLTEARKLLKDIIKDCNDQLILFNSFLAIGIMELKEKNYTESINQLEEAIKIDSTKPEPYNQLGIVYSDQQNYQKSLESLQFAILRDPSNSNSHFLLGNSLKQQGKAKEAIQAYDKAIQLRPQFYEAILNKGNLLLGQNNFEGAIECYELSLQINPSDQVIFNNKGNALKFLKRYDQALIQYNKAIEINPNFVLAYSNRAKCYIEMQKQVEGLKDLKYVNELIKNTENTKDLSPQNLNFIKSTIDQIIKIENQFAEVEEQAKRLSQKKQDEINMKLKELQIEKDEQNKKSIAQFSDFKDSHNNQSINNQLNIMDQLKQLMSEIDRAENEQIELQKEVDLQVELQKQDEEKLEQIVEVLQVTGTYDQAWIAQKFKEYSEESPPDRHDYAKAFYWTILNLFDSYRLANTGILVINEQKGDSKAEEVGVSVAKAVLSAGSSLPVFGGIFSAIDGAIGVMYKEQKQARIKSIANIIQNNKDESSQLKEQQSLMFAKAALKVSDLKVPIFKQKNYLRNKELQEFNKRESGIIKFILQKVKDIKESLKDSKDLYSSLGAEEALADVMILMSYMYKNSQEITQSSKDIPLDEQIVEIIQSQSLFKALSLVDGQDFDEKPIQQLQIKTADAPSAQGSGCCYIF